MNRVNNVDISVVNVKTSAFDGQKPGTSGLRKKVTVFQEPHYLENFVQSVFNCLSEQERTTLIVGGDGRYFNDHAIQRILAMAVANGFSSVIVGQHGIVSTPAASHLIRLHKACGGLILSASHNPAGPKEDFGIKFNNASGSPAPEKVTDAIYQQTQTLDSYAIAEMDPIDLAAIGQHKIGNADIQVVDSVTAYADLQATLFDFDLLKQAFGDGRLSLCFDAMHAVTGPYAKEIFEKRLGAAPGSVINGIPKDDFGGGHPDPNLVHAKQLIDIMNQDGAPVLGAASDGDGDRNLIAGRNTFVSPSDSLAAIALHHAAVPQFAKGLPGVARSMPTSTALDRVAELLSIPCYETPTGWKFFGNLLDAGKVSLCGEESFGTSGDHVREKDGIWAVLCWLSIIASTEQEPAAILQNLWERTGRSLYCRHDYEQLEGAHADALMQGLIDRIPTLAGANIGTFTVSNANVFKYCDPVDDSVSDNQGVRIFLTDGSRIVFRLSGTGTGSATVRVYLELFSDKPESYTAVPSEVTAELGEAARIVSKLTEITGKTEPSVIT